MSNSQISIKSSCWQRWWLLSLIFGGLIFLNVTVFFPPEMTGRRVLKSLFHYCDYHQWPAWYATLLWIVAAGTVLSTILQFVSVRNIIGKLPSCGASERKTSQSINASSLPFYGTLIILAIVAFFVCCPPGDLIKLLAKISYYWFYLRFCYGPFIELFEAGIVTWRLFVVPAIGLIVILSLLRLRRKREVYRGT